MSIPVGKALILKPKDLPCCKNTTDAEQVTIQYSTTTITRDIHGHAHIEITQKTLENGNVRIEQFQADDQNDAVYQRARDEMLSAANRLLIHNWF